MFLKSVDAEVIIVTSVFLIVYLISETITGALQAAYAKYLGDDTAERYGFLTLNPFMFVDPLGMLSLLLLKIGWGKQVPIDPRLVRRPLRSLKIASLYSLRIIAHIVLAFIAVFFLAYVKPLPLIDLLKIHFFGFQMNGGLVAKGYSGGSIIAGLFGIRFLFYNSAMVILRVFVNVCYFVLEKAFDFFDLDFEFNREMIFWFVFGLIFLFGRELAMAIQLLDTLILSFFFRNY